ncbi:activated Cdc42 kinase-like isoform X2 [Asterias rubens]|uniref:activated Cdc42 kinase-like isoform X2 n=1 Tax=Asterias rubens TaxID=7604 RepID=UPI001454E843|nr:activated Cdc42 kinase-like isoform X2 [Asterias rubens]
MPYEGTLYEFLSEVGLQQYHHDFVNKLGVTAIDHLAYVQTDDVLHVGMTAPEWRRLKASMKKVKKGKFKPGKGVKASKTKPTIVRVPSQPGTPSGGHIIPASAINILDRELGRGEFGKVMQGVWTDKDGQKIQVAVKYLSPERLSADKAQDFVKEAAIMYSLNHDHLVKLFGVVLDVEASLMLVTEFAALRSLLENIKQPSLRPSFPITLLLEFAGQIADAMKYLHLSNIIHRDLATRNILLFVDDDGTKKVKISDFGLSRRLILGENYRSEMKPNLKLPLAWMPVEALTKLTFTKASDVWSFGVTMWEMFTYGQQPWSTHSGEEILKAIDKPALQRLERPEACPVKIYDIILKCWKHEPEKRPSFAEIGEELPKAKPLQVRALSQYKAAKDGELTYRADDIITVLESNEQTGVWTGILPLGKVGTFLRCNTTLMGSSSGGGSRLRRWKSGFRSDKRDQRKSWHGRLTADAIGTPMGARHIFHVGPDGSVQGDATFGGDYRTLPPDGRIRQPWSSSSSVSSASSASNTRSPPRSPYRPNPSSSSTLPPGVTPSQSVSSLPPHTTKVRNNSEMTSSTPELASSAARYHDDHNGDQSDDEEDLPRLRNVSAPVSVAQTSRIIEEPSISPQMETVVEATMSASTDRSPSPDTISNLEMGSLLDEFMNEWDDRRHTVEVLDSGKLTSSRPKEDRNKNWELGATNGDSPTSGNTPRPGSLHLSSSSGSEGMRLARGGTGVLRTSSKKKGTVGTSGADGTAEENSPYLTPLHNMIIKDSPSNPAKTYRRVPSFSGTPPTAGGAMGGRESPDDSCRSSEVPDVRLRVNLDRASSLRDKKDEVAFMRLSTSPSQKAENDYIDTSDLVRSNPQSPAIEASVTRQPFTTSMSTSSSSSSERTSSPLSISTHQKPAAGDFSNPNEYEELSEATSNPPEDVVSEMLPKPHVRSFDPLKEVGRSKSMRVPVSRPAMEDAYAKRKGQFGRSRSLKETAATARAEEVYAKLIGGRISGSSSPLPRASPPVASLALGKGSPGKSKNPFVEMSESPTESPSGRQVGVLERMSSHESSDGGWQNSASDHDSRELQFGPGDPLDDSVAAGDNKQDANVGVRALRSIFDAPSAPLQIAEATQQKPPPPKVPPRSRRSLKSSEPKVVKPKTNIELPSPSGITHSPRGLNNNYSLDGDNEFGSEKDQSVVVDIKLSPKTIQSLERVMPRRVRRPIGEGRIKRRGSSDVSDSDNDSNVKHLSADFTSRSYDGDSSSDEAPGKFVTGEIGVGYPSRPLPDLPEDQTNRQTTRNPLPLPPRASSNSPRTQRTGLAESPGSTSDGVVTIPTNEVERVDIAEFFVPRQTPPRTPTRTTFANSDSDNEERYALPPTLNGSLKQSRKPPMIRSHTVDAPIVPKRHSANPFATSFRPPLLTSHSLDLGTSRDSAMANHVVASPEDIRQLIRRESALEMQMSESSTDDESDDNNDYIECRIVKEDLSDMPRRPPPPVPVRSPEGAPVRISKASISLDVKIPAYQSETLPFPAEPVRASKPAELIRETEYEIMQPQRDSVFFSETKQVNLFATPPKDIPLEEREIPPLPPLPGTDLGVLSRSRSAHSFSNSNGASDYVRERRGTIASTRPSEALKESDECHGSHPGTKSLDRLERKSRSFDDLQDDDVSGLKVAESLNDVLARTYRSPPAPNPTYISPRPQTGTYPRTQRTPHLTGHPQIPREPPPSIGNHTVPPPLPHRPSEDYIDMSNQKKKVSGVENGPAVGSQRALDVQLVRREIPEEISVDECSKVLRENLWNVPLTIKILKTRYLKRTLLLDDQTCRQALGESDWDLNLAMAIIGASSESSISL